MMTTLVRNGIDCSVCGTPLEDGAGRDGLCTDCLDLGGTSIEVIESNGRYDFIYDASIRIAADSKEEADKHLGELEVLVEQAGYSLVVFDAYSIEDGVTGEEIRPLG